ncbi:MAG: DUF4982 domain-containing protein [Lachnospiraceae bacterium]|nr:DUF4982 domain-containing protein [Lachnospiraceae bacterium]
MRRLFNDGWEFSKQKPGTDIDALASMEFARINVPHDWMIGNVADLYENSVGFYRRKFSLEKKAGSRYEIYFEGVYMDSTLYVNGLEAGVWKYGYSSFFFDITELLKDGENEVLVKVVYQSPNSRWYSGAGIYRDVYFIEHPEVHFVTDSVYLSAKPVTENGIVTTETALDKEWLLLISAEIANGAADSKWNKGFTGLAQVAKETTLSFSVPELGLSFDTTIGDATAEVYDDQTVRVEWKAKIHAPQLWSLENPKLYECEVSLGNGDTKKERFGFRSFTFDTNQGFFLNGEHVKINGVCEHHDLGAIGACFNRTAMQRKYEILRTMGINAIRTAHNMPAAGLLDLADEMGFLVMDEAFDMWEGSKTEFDYGRFFVEWQERDVRSWIRRDRNHPSIFLWSIGNEIYDTHKDAHGQDITRYLQKEAKENDPNGNAVVGMGSNYMPWENTQKCADILKYVGYNYAEKFYNEHHAAHPDWYIFGSETASTVQSRGIYHFPYERAVLADDNWQCSSLGNSTTSWGAPNPEHCVIQERDHDFSMGQFLWSGFDYIGEPTPYHTRNSYFGQIDTAGFPKDSYYVYKAAWTKEPFVHVFPYWDFNPGQTVDVRVVSNAPVVELFVNGESLGRKKIDHEHGTVLSGDYQTQYAPGEITAVAYDADGKEVARQTRHSFGNATALVANVYKPEKCYTAGCGDMAFIEVSAVDADGHPVENACNIVKVSVKGAGWLTGLDNGNSADEEEYKGCEKRLFSGKMLVCIAVGSECGEISVDLQSEGLTGAPCTLQVTEKKEIQGISLIPEVLDKGVKNAAYPRKIELLCDGDRQMTKEHQEVQITAKIYPPEAAQNLKPEDLIWKAVTDDGIESNIAKITKIEGMCATVKALGDGNFRLRCMTKCGSDPVKVISELEFTAAGIGVATLDPYHYVAGGLWSYGEGEIGVGNEHGVSTARGERSVVGFENINFGAYGSDEITIDIFNLSDDPFDFELWEGIPGQAGSEKLLDGHYHKKSIWNVYQPETYHLSRRMKGLSNLYIVAEDKVHFGGFTFTEYQKAYERLNAGECDEVYGDSYEKKADCIAGIGNNVTVEFKDMNFCNGAVTGLEITGVSHIPVNTIHVIFDNGTEEVRDILEFAQDGSETQSFNVSSYSGKGTIRLVFLPGSSFDLIALQFQE